MSPGAYSRVDNQTLISPAPRFAHSVIRNSVIGRKAADGLRDLSRSVRDDGDAAEQARARVAVSARVAGIEPQRQRAAVGTSGHSAQ